MSRHEFREIPGATTVKVLLGALVFGVSIASASPPGDVGGAGPLGVAVPAQRLFPVPDGFGREGDLMGSVSILGDALIAGSPGAVPPDSQANSGVAQIFRNGASGWEREAILVPQHQLANQQFGGVVAMGNDVVAIGAPGPPIETFVFRHVGADWVETDELTFGSYPAISGDTLAIASNSAVRVYAYQAGTWVTAADLPLDDVPNEYASTVALSGDALAFTTAIYDGLGQTRELIYFYSRSNDVWTRDTKIDLGYSPVPFVLLAAVALSGESAILAHGNAVEMRSRGDGAWDVAQQLNAGIPWSELGASSVAIDGDRAVVGCTFASPQGSAIVFEKAGGVWSRVSRPYDVGGTTDDGFGSSVALSGEELVVGSPLAVTDGVPSGKVTPFVVDGTSWTASPSLDEGDAHAHEAFGSQVVLSESSALASAPLAGVPAVYAFDVVGDHWVERARLVSQASSRFSTFATAIALDGDTAAIGSKGDRYDGETAWNAVYVYGRAGDGWDVAQRLESDRPLGYFGISLGLDGDSLVVGDVQDQDQPGRAVAFARSGGNWTQQAVIVPNESAANDQFGWATALSGGTLVVGAPSANAGIEGQAGAAYVFADVGGNWEQQARLTAPIPFQGHQFGNAVAAATDRVIVAAARPTGPDGEAAFVFARDGGVWALEATLSLPGTGDLDFAANFQVALSADGTLAAIGAPQGPTGGVSNGAAYIFRRNGTTWTLASVQHGNGNSGASTDAFGVSVSISSSAALVGAPSELIGGAAYVVPLGDALFANGFD